jgi:hypothetical protein
MILPWATLDSFVTKDEFAAELRRRGKNDVPITVKSQILMISKGQQSERALGVLACKKDKQRLAPRVLVGDLRVAITLRAVATCCIPPAIQFAFSS